MKQQIDPPVIDPALDARIKILEVKDATLYTESWTEIGSGTSGTISPLPGHSFVSDQWPDGIDAIVEGITGGVPDGTAVYTAAGALVTATFDTGTGDYILSGTPVSYPVALVTAQRSIGVQNTRTDHGTVSSGTIEISAESLSHTINGTGDFAFTLVNFSAACHSVDIYLTAAEGISITPPMEAVVDMDSPRDFDDMEAGEYRIRIDSKDNGTSYGVTIESITAGPLAALPLSGTIYTDSDISLLFGEEIEASTVFGGANGYGSLKLWNVTTKSWPGFAYSTADDLTYAINPTSALTGGDDYLVIPTKEIMAKSGRFYSGRPRSFTAVDRFYQSNASLLDDDCTSLTGWTVTNGKSGPNTTIVTFDGKSCFKQLNTTAEATNYTLITRDVGAFGDRLTISIGLYLALIGPGEGGNDSFQFDWWDGTKSNTVYFLGTDLMTTATPSNIHSGFSTPVGGFYHLCFDFDLLTNKLDIYAAPYGGLQTKVANQIDFGYTTGGTNGTIRFFMRGSITANTLAYLDYIKLGDGLVSV